MPPNPMVQIDTDAQSHTTEERICVRRRERTWSRESESTSASPQNIAREREALWLRTGSGPANHPVTHRHIPGHFRGFFHVNAVFRPVTHPHVKRDFGW